MTLLIRRHYSITLELRSRSRRGVAFICMFLTLGCGGGASADQPRSDQAIPRIALPMRGNAARFIVVGDTGVPNNQLFNGITKVHRERSVDAILLMGDNFYPCGVKSVTENLWKYFSDDIGRTDIPVFPVLGNHDYGSPLEGGRRSKFDCPDANPGAQIDATRRIANWNFPARTYLLSAGPVDIVMIDTTPIAQGWKRSERGSATSSEVQQALDLALRSSTARWKIVGGHHVLYSSGSHGVKSGAETPNMRKLLPILRSNAADLYASGHDHHLELIGAVAERPLFLVSGAGANTRPYRRRPPGEPSTIFPRDGRDSFRGFAVIDVDETQMTITFHDREGGVRSEPIRITKSPRH